MRKRWSAKICFQKCKQRLTRLFRTPTRRNDYSTSLVFRIFQNLPPSDISVPSSSCRSLETGSDLRSSHIPSMQHDWKLAKLGTRYNSTHTLPIIIPSTQILGTSGCEKKMKSANHHFYFKSPRDLQYYNKLATQCGSHCAPNFIFSEKIENGVSPAVPRSKQRNNSALILLILQQILLNNCHDNTVKWLRKTIYYSVKIIPCWFRLIKETYGFI